MIKVLLIDDEEMALEQLRFVLGQYHELEIVAAFMDPVAALNKVRELRPDVVFLDVMMPEINGIAVAEEMLRMLPGTFVVFVTAFDEYAVRAFEVNAVDYVLKPVSKARIDTTIRRIIARFGRSRKENPPDLGLGRVGRMYRPLTKVLVWEDDKITVLDPAEVLLLSFRNRDVIVVTKHQEYQSRHTLNYWEERLSRESFFRCHRSFLVNLHRVEKIIPMFNSTYLLRLRDYPHEVPVSRTRVIQLNQILGL